MDSKSVPWKQICDLYRNQAQPTAPWGQKGRTLMFDGLFQPMHLIVVLFIALWYLDRRNCPNWVRGSAMASEASKTP
jgi:hypothetical protein